MGSSDKAPITRIRAPQSTPHAIRRLLAVLLLFQPAHRDIVSESVSMSRHPMQHIWAMSRWLAKNCLHGEVTESDILNNIARNLGLGDIFQGLAVKREAGRKRINSRTVRVSLFEGFVCHCL